MDVHELAVRIRDASYGAASAEAVRRQVAGIEQVLGAHADDFGYDRGDLSVEQAAALEENYTAERDLPVVAADDIRDLYEAHEPGAVPHNDDVIVIAVDPSLWEDYAIVSAGEAGALGFRVLYRATQLAERLGGAELTDDLAEEIAWEVTSEVSPR
ncbi:hypothetical protein HDA32_001101 [Spinactinospora alkalitolerans]|uniref:Uncharacterized protein n=1 Tax=Spinactinospora alkalitolerans TaxID=687207 RepID=A0A852TQZ9_9ACTN|nr:hypothetical protein [Spinactinospora alkalitolerans]NYE45981.1 hypothetical protein [Spinactinospora alkalitolerans]